ncbi:MAG: Methyltransferase [Enterovirga sp.]|nr:Methyltransferase [Enterovirga sp.]
MAQQSNSQQAGLSSLERLAYLGRLSLLHWQRLRAGNEFREVRRDIETYSSAYRGTSGRDLATARILELGFGQRPFRLFALQSLGLDARGIDLDAPSYTIGPRAILAVARRNGLVRALKSLARRILFDGAEYRDLARVLKEGYGRDFAPDLSRLIVGDASAAETWDRAGRRFDFIYSEDVLEHIPAESLPSVVALMAARLADDGVAVVTPMVFPGIAGGHDMGWYPHQVEHDGVARGPAWGHLTGESRAADTFLNRLSLAEYRALFAQHFEIVSEEPLLGDLGRRHLTADRRAALAGWDDEELFSNQVRFVLRKVRPNATAPGAGSA